MTIHVKRIYEPAAVADGYRILVDRLWPRGVSKQQAAVDFWARTVAPSEALRKWYRHEKHKWPEFKRRYFAELQANADAVAELRELRDRDVVTLLFSSRETEFNNAHALRDYLDQDPR